MIIEEAMTDYNEKGSLAALAIPFAFHTGLNINEVRKLVGHEDERTTYHNYSYNHLTKGKTEMKLEQAMSVYSINELMKSVITVITTQ